MQPIRFLILFFKRRRKGQVPNQGANQDLPAAHQRTPEPLPCRAYKVDTIILTHRLPLPQAVQLTTVTDRDEGRRSCHQIYLN